MSQLSSHTPTFPLPKRLPNINHQLPEFTNYPDILRHQTLWRSHTPNYKIQLNPSHPLSNPCTPWVKVIHPPKPHQYPLQCLHYFLWTSLQCSLLASVPLAANTQPHYLSPWLSKSPLATKTKFSQPFHTNSPNLLQTVPSIIYQNPLNHSRS